MNRLHSWMRASRFALVVAVMGSTACGLDKQEMPTLTGPSGPGRSVVMTASPDQLPRDATSQSIVTLEIRDAGGSRTSGQLVTLVVTPGASLSQSQVTTGADGKASFAVTAPGPTALMPNNVIVVTAVPVGANFDNAISGSLSIALLGVSNSTAPTAAFTVTPAAPELNQLATFDATTSTDEGSQCKDACTYAWNFDDGTTATGRVVTHSFSVARSYNVALTVTDGVGLTSTLRLFVTPTAPAAPTVVLTVSPTTPVVDQVAVFKAVGTPAVNHSIVRYDWDFGDGAKPSTTTGTINHTYTTRGIFNVVVTVTDDLGQQGHATAQFNLTVGVPTGINATFFFSPTSVKTNTGQVQFNANESTPSNGATITQYKWNWGTPGVADDETANPIVLHTFPNTANTYVVQLTIVDSAGRTSQTKQNIGVTAP